MSSVLERCILASQRRLSPSSEMFWGKSIPVPPQELPEPVCTAGVWSLHSLGSDTGGRPKVEDAEGQAAYKEVYTTSSLLSQECKSKPLRLSST